VHLFTIPSTILSTKTTIKIKFFKHSDMTEQQPEDAAAHGKPEVRPEQGRVTAPCREFLKSV